MSKNLKLILLVKLRNTTIRTKLIRLQQTHNITIKTTLIQINKHKQSKTYQNMKSKITKSLRNFHLSILTLSRIFAIEKPISPNSNWVLEEVSLFSLVLLLEAEPKNYRKMTQKN